MGTKPPPPKPSIQTEMYCKSCGYVLVGLPRRHKEFGAEDSTFEAVVTCFMQPQRCPECGRRFNPKDPRTYYSGAAFAQRQRRKRLALRIVAVAIALVLICGVLYWRHVYQQRILANLTAAGFKYTPQADVLGRTAKTITVGSSVDDEALVTVAPFTKATSLDLGGSAVTDVGLRHIRGLVQLERLNLSGTKITDNTLEGLVRLARLETLDLQETNVTREGVDQLTQVLRNLKVVRPWQALPESTTTLRLGGKSLSQAELKHLEGFPDLISLDLQEAKLDYAGLESLKKLTKLEILNLNGTRISDEVLAHLKDMSNLRSLYLVEANVTDDGLKDLRRFQQLETLDLTDTRVGNRGLEHLKELANLEFLGLSGTRVSDAGVAHLEALAELKSVELSRTQVTAKGVARLKQALPNVQVTRQ